MKNNPTNLLCNILSCEEQDLSMLDGFDVDWHNASTDCVNFRDRLDLEGLLETTIDDALFTLQNAMELEIVEYRDAVRRILGEELQYLCNLNVNEDIDYIVDVKNHSIKVFFYRKETGDLYEKYFSHLLTDFYATTGLKIQNTNTKEEQNAN